MSNGQVRITMKPSIRGRLLHPFEFERLFKQAQREAAQEAQLIFRIHAGRRRGRSREVRSGRLVRGIHVIPTGAGGFIVTAEAKNPETGYDYVAVSRFGHKGRIEPKNAPRGVGVAGKREGDGRSPGVLAFRVGGKMMFRRSTKGFHPSSDWVTDALPEVQFVAGRAMGRLARRIQAS